MPLIWLSSNFIGHPKCFSILMKTLLNEIFRTCSGTYVRLDNENHYLHVHFCEPERLTYLYGNKNVRNKLYR